MSELPIVGAPLIVNYDDYVECHERVQSEYDCLLGQVLTLIDASVHGEQANKAIKDIIKTSFRKSFQDHTRDTLVDCFNVGKKQPRKEIGIVTSMNQQ